MLQFNSTPRLENVPRFHSTVAEDGYTVTLLLDDFAVQLSPSGASPVASALTTFRFSLDTASAANRRAVTNAICMEVEGFVDVARGARPVLSLFANGCGHVLPLADNGVDSPSFRRRAPLQSPPFGYLLLACLLLLERAEEGNAAHGLLGLDRIRLELREPRAGH